MLERVAEHLSWRANQCNLAARAAKDAGNDATDRLRTLQAREFFRGAARMAEGKQAGIHVTLTLTHLPLPLTQPT